MGACTWLRGSGAEKSLDMGSCGAPELNTGGGAFGWCSRVESWHMIYCDCGWGVESKRTICLASDETRGPEQFRDAEVSLRDPRQAESSATDAPCPRA